MQMRSLTERLVVSALLVALGVALQIFENMLPIMTSVPGGKIGLANIVTLVLLYIFDFKTAFTCSVLRAFLASLLYGGVSAIIYSVSAAAFSAVVMAVLMKRAKSLTPVGISVCGAFCHNAAQVCVASIILSNVWIFTYLPILGIVSCVSGVVTGYAAKLVLGYFLGRQKEC